MNITVIIPTHNEASLIASCIESVAFASEVIVIDSHSTDQTVQIATKAGAKVISQTWEGFAKQKNSAAKLAKSEWLLFIDADERVSGELADELSKLDPQAYNLFQLPRANYFLGKKLTHGGWYPDYQRRLVKKVDFLKWQGDLHENIIVHAESLGTLTSALIHFSHRDPDSMMDKTKIYAKKVAKLKFKAAHPPVKPKHLIAAVGHEVITRGIKQSGWKDGLPGWIEIFFQSFSAFMTCFYLWEMQNEPLSQQYEKLDTKLSQQKMN